MRALTHMRSALPQSAEETQRPAASALLTVTPGTGVASSTATPSMLHWSSWPLRAVVLLLTLVVSIWQPASPAMASVHWPSRMHRAPARLPAGACSSTEMQCARNDVLV